MKLRIKTLTVLGTALTCLILLMYGLSSTILMDGFKQVERKDTEENLSRIDKAISNELSQMSSTTRDYSGWDDSYNYVQGKDPQYVDVNLVDATFVSLKLNMMVFVNSSNEIIFKKEVDLGTGNMTTFPDSFLNLLTPGSPLVQFESVNNSISGIVLLPEGPLLVSAYPVIHSDRTGPIVGAMIFGRNLDAREIEHLSNVTQLDLSIYSITNPHLPSDLKQANSTLNNNSHTFIKTLSEEKIAGYIYYNDIFGNKIVIIKILQNRDIYEQGKSTINYFFIAMIIICIVVGILIMMFMEVFVLTRLRHLSSSINMLGSKDPNSGAIYIQGEDEFATFAKALRGKLESLNIMPVNESTDKIGATSPIDRNPQFPDLVEGKVYFLDEPKADRVFKVFSSAVAKGHQGLCVTRLAPKRVREDAGLEKTPIVWLSTTAAQDEKILDPSSIARIHSTILEFMNAAKKPIVLIEGIEYLIFVNNFRYVLTMLNSLYERTVSSEGILLLVLSRPTMVPADWSLLTKDMEEIGPTLSQGPCAPVGAADHAAKDITKEK